MIAIFLKHSHGLYNLYLVSYGIVVSCGGGRALSSSCRFVRPSQAWKLNFSQQFDGLGHENRICHIFRGGSTHEHAAMVQNI